MFICVNCQMLLLSFQTSVSIFSNSNLTGSRGSLITFNYIINIIFLCNIRHLSSEIFKYKIGVSVNDFQKNPNYKFICLIRRRRIKNSFFSSSSVVNLLVCLCNSPEWVHNILLDSGTKFKNSLVYSDMYMCINWSFILYEINEEKYCIYFT